MRLVPRMSTADTGARIRARSDPSKPTGGGSRKSGQFQSGGLLADAFRNAQAQKTDCLDEVSRSNASIGCPTHEQAPIDLTDGKDDPIEEEVASSVQVQVTDALEK